jgi:hypothetical protein
MNKFITALVGTAAMAASTFAGTAMSGKGVAPVAPAPANDDLGFTVGLGYDSDFYFRGLQLADDWVNASLSYSTDIAEGLALGVGANYGSTFGTDGYDYDRLVLNAGLTKQLGAIEATLGYRYYINDRSVDSLIQALTGLDGALADTSEVFLNLGTTVGPVNIGLATNYDITNEGWYFELGANSEIKLTERISLVPGANIGYAQDYNWQGEILGGSLDGFTAVTVSLAAPIKLNSRATLTPYVAGRLPVDALDDVGVDNEIYGGVSLSVSF